LPDVVPIHFDYRGLPDSYGSKIVILYIATALISVQIILLLVVVYRFKIVNKYPYLVSYPLITILIGSDRISPDRKSHYINETGKVTLIENLLLGILNVYILYDTYISMICRYMVYPLWTIIFMIIPIVIYPIIAYRRLYSRLKSEIDGPAGI